MNVIIDSGALYGLRMFGLALALGAALGAVRCVFDVAEAAFSWGNVGCAVSDFIFWCAAGIAAFMLMLSQNSGMVRGYIIFGCFSGTIMFRLIAGALVRTAAVRFFSSVKSAAERILTESAARKRQIQEKNKKKAQDTCKKNSPCI